jgi:hypothetical protein
MLLALPQLHDLFVASSGTFESKSKEQKEGINQCVLFVQWNTGCFLPKSIESTIHRDQFSSPAVTSVGLLPNNSRIAIDVCQPSERKTKRRSQ